MSFRTTLLLKTHQPILSEFIAHQDNGELEKHLPRVRLGCSVVGCSHLSHSHSAGTWKLDVEIVLVLIDFFAPRSDLFSFISCSLVRILSNDVRFHGRPRSLQDRDKGLPSMAVDLGLK